MGFRPMGCQRSMYPGSEPRGWNRRQPRSLTTSSRRQIIGCPSLGLPPRTISSPPMAGLRLFMARPRQIMADHRRFTAGLRRSTAGHRPFMVGRPTWRHRYTRRPKARRPIQDPRPVRDRRTERGNSCGDCSRVAWPARTWAGDWAQLVTKPIAQPTPQAEGAWAIPLLAWSIARP
jgi:hypothetical protein